MSRQRWAFCLAWGALVFLGGRLIELGWPETGSAFVYGVGAGLFLHAALRWSAEWLKRVERKGK